LVRGEPPTPRIAHVLIDAEGRYLQGDSLALELLGVDAAGLCGHTVGDFTLPELREATRASWQHLAATGETRYLIDETFLVRADGTATVVKVHPVMPGETSGTWWSQFELIPGPRGRTLHLARPTQVLNAWRAAERRAIGLPEGSLERDRAERAAAGLGALYRAALDYRIAEEHTAGG
jgi:PAS domain S-box-containing protein